MKSVAPTFLPSLIFLSLVVSVEASDVWFVDTRSADTTDAGRIAHLSMERIDAGPKAGPKIACRTPSSVQDFFQTHDPNKPTIILIHGNWMTCGEMRSYGLAFHRKTKHWGEHRLVLWCWPAAKEYCRIRPDAQTKYHRADAQGYILAAFLRDFRREAPEAKISILGFSFGAKVTCKALHELGRDDRAVEYETFQIRPVLLAAAMDQSSLSAGGPYRHAWHVIDKMLVHVNHRDKTLRFYPLLFKRGGPEAVGKGGMTGISAERRRKVKTASVTKIIGREHGFNFSLRGIIVNKNDFRHYVLFQ